MNKIIKPVIVLTLICLVVSVLLAAVNSVTKPIIDEYEAKVAEKACSDVMPYNYGFTQIALPEGVPSTVKAVYKENSGLGYVYKMVTTGFSSGFQIMCGISVEGKITGTKVLAHSETPGYGSRTSEREYTDRFIGRTAALEGDLLLSGATVSSKAFKAAIADAFTADTMITK